MLLKDAIKLIDHPLIQRENPTSWADLGCGRGLFTNAMTGLMASGSKIYAVDKDSSAFEPPKPDRSIHIEKINADFVDDELPINTLDGILMANSLHFVKDKKSFLKRTSSYFAARKLFLFVEYDMDSANPWVPYPISFKSLTQLTKDLGYGPLIKIYELPSRYNRSNIYSAIVQGE